MKRFSQQKARGFVLQELLLGVAVIAILALVGAGIYTSLRSGVSSADMGDKTIGMVTSIQNNWQKVGSYATVSAAEVNKLAIIKAPLRYDGTNLTDAWGNTMQLNGGISTFALTLGGTTQPITREDCADVVAKLASIASNINIGAAATLGSGATAGTITGGNAYKTGATITQTGLTTGCSEASTVIAAQFR